MPRRHRAGISATSVVRHVEEIVLATSGHDAFEVVFAVAAARLVTRERLPVTRAIRAAARAHPVLEVVLPVDTSADLLARVDELLGTAHDGWEGTLDAVFESLVPRLAKSDKGQFFTPRPVVDFVVRLLAPLPGEVVVDPACGSGAFLSRARARKAHAYGCDVDVRAVRVARLLALAAGADPTAIRRGDGLHDALPLADVVATNPPFAGRAPAEGFEVARLVRAPERDVLFLERALALLKPGGRLGIVLPYNKANGASYAALRRWFVERARILAVVGLPRETFLPHTSQKTFVLFAKKRAGDRAQRSERTLFVVSERAGKDTGGEPIFRANRELDHDLDEITATVASFLAKERFA